MFPLMEETSHGVTEVAEVAVAVSSIRSSQVRHGAAVKGGSTLCQWQGGGREASKISNSPLLSIDKKKKAKVRTMVGKWRKEVKCSSGELEPICHRSVMDELGRESKLGW